MSKIRFSEEKLLAQLRAETSAKGGLKAIAERLEFSSQFILDVVKGHKAISPRLAEKMGYRRVVVFERIPKEEASSLKG